MEYRNAFVLILTGFAGLAQAQQGQVTGPVAGYVFDSAARAVRPVLGIPGASILGDAVPVEYSIGSATVSPRADTAVAITPEGVVHLLRLSGGGATEIPLNGAPAAVERVVFSASGAAFALIAGSRAQVFTVQPDAAALAATIDLSSAGQAEVEVESVRASRPGFGSAALSDDGSWMLLAANGSAQLIGTGGARAIGTASRGSFVVFAPDSHDAAIADPRGSLVLIRNADGAGTPTTLSTDAAKGAAGVAFSADGKSLFVAVGQGVRAFDLASGMPAAVNCTCTATGLVRMGNVYRLNELGSGPLWLLDPAGTPRIVFVPAGGSE
jgi:hypothetical protein